MAWWLDLEQDKLWYLVGLIASDGCLSPDGRHIDITSSDDEFLKKIREVCNIKARVTKKSNGRGDVAFRIQIGSIDFYDFLSEVGLTPKKSKTLRALNIPRENFHSFLRGEIDGDGCIRRWIHPTNKKEQWSLRIVSGSWDYLEWIRGQSESYFKVRGRLYKDRSGGFCKYVLKYGKLAAQIILKH